MKRNHININRNAQGGFTLLELLITVGIMAILATLAVTAYSDYSGRVQASEGIQLAQGPMLSATIAYQEGQGTPGMTNTDLGINPALLKGQYVSQVTSNATGAILIAYRNDAPGTLAGKILFMTPYETGAGGTILWRCGNGPVPNDGAATPVDFSLAGTAAGTPVVGGVSDVPNELLPRNCRA